MPAEDLIQGYEAYLASVYSSPRTIEGRRNILTLVDNALPYGLENAHIDEIREWLAHFDNAWTVNTYVSAITGFYRWAFTDGYLRSNPTEQLARPKTPDCDPRPISHNELRRLLATAPEPYRLWATVAAYAGLRRIEIFRLHRSHVNEERVQVLVGKGGKRRSIPTHPAVWSAMRDLPDGPITDLPTEQILGTRFLSWCQRHDLPGVGLHRLRHYFATEVLARTGNLRLVQVLLGHSSPATTAMYTKVADPALKAAVLALPTVSSAPYGTPPTAAA